MVFEDKGMEKAYQTALNERGLCNAAALRVMFIEGVRHQLRVRRRELQEELRRI